MQPRSIGLVGGAGPLAGAFLFKRILELAGREYGCCRDADFPEILLISFPFAEMLSGEVDARKVRDQLRSCLSRLRKNGAAVLAIACNTLHLFLDETEIQSGDLISLPQVVADEARFDEEPLVFCTATSAQFGLHRRFFSCVYPDQQTQREVDCLIDQILRGMKPTQKLEALLQKQSAGVVLLGCTEFSLVKEGLSLPCGKRIVDPLEILAEKLLEESFAQKGGGT